MRRCAVTGMGLLSCLGLGSLEHFLALSQGKSGVAPIKSFDASGYKPAQVGEVRAECLRAYRDSLLLAPERAQHRKELLALTAASAAWRDARLLAGAVDVYAKERRAVIIGTGLLFGCEPVQWLWEEQRMPPPPRFGSADLHLLADNDQSVPLLAELSAARGPQLELNSACAASGHALGIGSLLIRSGQADLVVAGGVDAMINPIGVAGFQLLGATSQRPAAPGRACRPFDRRRDGTVIGEGAAILILEEAERAAARGQPIWGYIDGTGFSADGFSVTAPHPRGDGAARSMRAALQSASKQPSEIQYINAHGTGTFLNDIAEAEAIRQVFEEWADRLWVSSTKPMTGHLVAAAGALECAITFLSLNSGTVFPTVNLDQPDPACGLNHVMSVPRKCEVSCALSNSFGLGGQNSSLVLSAPTARRKLS